MSFDRLHPEIWTYLLTFLAVPLPKPLSGVTKEEAVGEDPGAISRLPSAGDAGTTSRKDIRADALAKLMRTSIAFNQLASAPLYKRVITDSLPSLTSHLDHPPAHPRVQSKLQLLKRVRYLHLEYDSKTRDPTYPEIMLDRRYLPAIGGPVNEGTIMHRADADAEQIDNCITSLVERKPIFESLITLSTAAVFGPQHGVWQRAMSLDPQGPLKNKIQSAAIKLLRAFPSSPLAEWCTRGSIGPFAVSIFKWEPSSLPKGHKTLFTAHVDELTDLIPAYVGGRTRWILENSIHGELMMPVCRLVDHWVTYFQRLITAGHLPASLFNIDVSASGGRTEPDGGWYRKSDIRVLTPEQERAEMTEKMTIVAGANVRLGAWAASHKDIYRFKSLPEAGPCLACGWCFEPEQMKEADEWLKGGGGWLSSWEPK